MLYDVHIPRCTHIKTNGTQCGSPALRGRRFCFFHKNWQGQRIQLNAQPASPLSFTMPVLEDADSVQVALMQVMRLILAGQLDPKIAGLLLYALQTASLNLRHMELEPRHLESVVIDPGAVADNGVGDDAWSEEEFEQEEGDEDEDQDEDGEEENSEDEEYEHEEEEDKEEDRDKEDENEEHRRDAKADDDGNPGNLSQKPLRRLEIACEPPNFDELRAGMRKVVVDAAECMGMDVSKPPEGNEKFWRDLEALSIGKN